MILSLNKILIAFLLITNTCFSQEQGNKVNFISGQLEVSLPNDFYKMTEEAIQVKYPYKNNRPQEVYTDELGKVNFTASLRENMPTQEYHLPEVKKVLLSNIEKRGVTLISDKFIKVNGKVFILLEFTSQGLDKEIYNMMYASNLNGKLLIGSFNFPNAEYDTWYNEAKYTISSLREL